ncbi:MAG TPA: acyl-CoA dehydrogenase family protein [Thermoanaerobaculia bacterium]|jgi:alkylation response protein AidB-like acyl-CoA dehydrogenase|nr:acyl-CoA dehydrogenase family protein [Thermoanaerobaculia bacterium]
MDFAVSEPIRDLTAAIRRFVDEEILPVERTVLERGFGAAGPEIERLRARLRGERFLALHMPKEWGGGGLSLLEFAPIGEALGRSVIGHYVFNVQAPDAGNMELLLHHGSPEQKEQWLRPLVAGDIRSCFGMTEPELAGSNPVRLGTTARREGDDYIIDGHKWFTSAAEGAAFCIVMAVTNPDAPKPHARASQILVPTDTPGFEIVQNLAVMGERGEGWMSHAEVRLDGARVPAANRIGSEGAGFSLAQERLGPGRIHHCVRWIGICERAFDLMCERAASRELAPGKPLGLRQIVQEWIAESRAEIDAARLLVLRTAWRIDREGAAAARDDVSLIKFHTAAVLQRVLDRAIQTHGALGLTEATPLAFWWRHERGARIYDGADEVHKTAAARRILERYGMKRGED